MTTLNIKTANGIYEVRKPAGKLGARNMIILSKLANVQPIKVNVENEDPAFVEKVRQMNNAKQMEAFGNVFEEWSDKILPTIVVKGPFTYEEMPGEDQLAIFLALTQETQVTEEFFQILPAEPSV
jgi:hypothetical protein